jgi:hypothetical protein
MQTPAKQWFEAQSIGLPHAAPASHAGEHTDGWH